MQIANRSQNGCCTKKYAQTFPVTPVVNKPAKLSKIVKTGDTSDVLLYMLIMDGGSVASAAGLKKRRDN